jgi:hypothetical protein
MIAVMGNLLVCADHRDQPKAIYLSELGVRSRARERDEKALGQQIDSLLGRPPVNQSFAIIGKE